MPLLLLILALLTLPYVLLPVELTWSLSRPAPGQFVWAQSPGPFWYVALVLRLGILALCWRGFRKGGDNRRKILWFSLVPIAGLAFLAVPLIGTGERFVISSGRVEHHRTEGPAVSLTSTEIQDFDLRESRDVSVRRSWRRRRSYSSETWRTDLHLGSRSGVTVEIPIREASSSESSGLSWKDMMWPQSGFSASDSQRRDLKAALAQVLPAAVRRKKSFVFWARDGRSPHLYQPSRVSTLAWRPRGNVLATSGENGISLWNPADGELKSSRWGGSSSIAWSPDGARLAATGDDEKVRIIDGESGKVLEVLEGGASRVQVVAWSPDGKSLAAGLGNGSVRVTDAGPGYHTRVDAVREGEITSLCWSPDSQWIAIGRSNNLVEILNASNGSLRRAAKFDSPVRQVSCKESQVAVAYGEYLGGYLDAHAKSGVEVLTSEGDRLVQIPTPADRVSWHQNGLFLAIGNKQMVSIWSAEQKKVIAGFHHQSSADNIAYQFLVSIEALGWSPDGSALAVANQRAVSIWDFEPRTGRVSYRALTVE